MKVLYGCIIFQPKQYNEIINLLLIAVYKNNLNHLNFKTAKIVNYNLLSLSIFKGTVESVVLLFTSTFFSFSLTFYNFRGLCSEG
jgi:hypothetical protein